MTMLMDVLDETTAVLEHTLENYQPRLHIEEIGTVTYLGNGIATVTGLPHVSSRELVHFTGGVLGMAFDLRPDKVGVILLGEAKAVPAGSEVRRTQRVIDVPVGDKLLGRVLDALGRPLDGNGPLDTDERWPVERPAPEIMDRAPVSEPLQTGLKIVDALIPIGRGQRELILGDRQTGKTTIAVDTIVNQANTDVLCVYCAIGQRDEAVARVIDSLRQQDALKTTVVIVATGKTPPGLRFVAPYAATSIAEYFMEQGRDVLIVYDDLTRHARAYRELSLLLRRPPGREAYPGDIFYVHSRLLERATHLRDEGGSGSLTALPIIETQAQNISAYIPTNLISMTDGQIYLSPKLFQKGVLPAIDPGQSVSRVGGKAQLPAYQAVAGDLRLTYSQFQELESFARFGARLDEETEQALVRGQCVREVMQQPQHEPLPVAEQIVVLLAASEGVFDKLEPEAVTPAAALLRQRFTLQFTDVTDRIDAGEELRDADRERMLELAREIVAEVAAQRKSSSGEGEG